MSKKKRICIWACIASITLIVLWIFGVEKSLYVEGCDDCIVQSYVTRYRIFGITVHESIEEHNTLFRSILQDLGLPCSHEGQFSCYTYKYMGLFLKCPQEDVESKITIADTPWYDDEMSAKTIALGKSNPQFAKDFYQHIVIDKDMKFISEFIKHVVKKPLDKE